MIGLSDNMKGVLLMVLSMAAFSFGDTSIKATAGAVPLSQLIFLRGVLASLALVVLARQLRALRWSVPMQDRVMIALRGLSESAAAYFFLTALLEMPIANVTAILQVLPLTVTLGGALFFGEQVGWRRWSAIAIGFLGMLLIVQPGSDGFSSATVNALLAVLAVTVRDLVTRKVSSAVPSLTITLWSSIAVTLFAGVWSFGQEWVALDGRLFALLLASTIFIIGGYAFSVMVMRVGEVGVVAPFRYTGLLWALLLGFVVFGEWPDRVTMLGAAIVVATGVFTLWREARVTRGRMPRKPVAPRQP